jgi:hypothetical protein
VPQRSPDHRVLVRALPEPLRDLQTVVATVLPHGEGRLRGRKHRKHLADGGLDCFIRLPHDLARRIVDSANREPPAPRPMRRFFQLAADQPTVQPMPFCCAHGAAES